MRFAAPTINGELERYLRDFTWAVRPPRGLQERAQQMARERDQLTTELGRSPTPAELSARGLLARGGRRGVGGRAGARERVVRHRRRGEPRRDLPAGRARPDQAEIAGHIGCSQMHVSRILRQALARLADEADSDGRRSLVRALD